MKGGRQMSTRMTEKFNRRNELILITAEELITTNGYHSATMLDIAKSLDIAKGTLYLHYKSKEALVFAIVKPKLIKFFEVTTNIVASGKTPQEKIRNMIEGGFKNKFFHFVLLSFPDMAAVFKEDRHNELMSIQQEILDCFAHVITIGKKESAFHTKLPSDYLALQLMQLFDPLIYNALVINGDMNHEDFIENSSIYFLNALNYKGGT